MSLKEHCRKTVEFIWTPKGVQELKAYLQKHAAHGVALEKPATNETEVFFFLLCATEACFT